MAYGHGDLLARLGECGVSWCPKPANGAKMDDGRRLCPSHALEALKNDPETVEDASAAMGICRECGDDLDDAALDYCAPCAGVPETVEPVGC